MDKDIQVHLRWVQQYSLYSYWINYSKNSIYSLFFWYTHTNTETHVCAGSCWRDQSRARDETRKLSGQSDRQVCIPPTLSPWKQKDRKKTKEELKLQIKRFRDFYSSPAFLSLMSFSSKGEPQVGVSYNPGAGEDSGCISSLFTASMFPSLASFPCVLVSPPKEAWWDARKPGEERGNEETCFKRNETSSEASREATSVCDDRMRLYWFIIYWYSDCEFIITQKRIMVSFEHWKWFISLNVSGETEMM